MAKRMQEQKGENRIVAKSRPTAIRLRREFQDTQSFESTGWIFRESANQSSNSDAVSSSQGWQRDAQLFISKGRPVATNRDQKSPNRQEKSVISTGEPVAAEYQRMFRKS